ncbi:MAG TPA: hypothetical protein VIE66_06330 [Methylocella sp.]|jgi:hypothetical protein
MIELGNYSLAAIFVTSIIVLLIASEVGHAIGWRAAEEPNVTTLEAAILGLLAPMISFTFSMGLTRFDERAATVAWPICGDAAMKGKYQAFIAAGKPPEVALTAIMPKLAIIHRNRISVVNARLAVSSPIACRVVRAASTRLWRT